MIDQQFVFPTGITWLTSLTNSNQTIVPVGVRRKLTHLILSGGAAPKLLLFTTINPSGNLTYVNVPAGSSLVIPGWETSTAGLQVQTASAAGDLDVTAFYVAPGV